MPIEHRVHDVDESLVAVEHAVAASQEVILQPALALVFAQHLDHAPFRRQRLVGQFRLCDPLAIGYLEHGIKPVRECFIRAPQPKVSLRLVVPDQIAEKGAEHTGVLGLDGTWLRKIDGVLSEVRQAQVLQKQAAIGTRSGAHAPPFSFGCQFLQIAPESAVGIEEFLGL